MTGKIKRFGFHAVITIKDHINGDTCVINTGIDKDTKKEVYEEIEKDLKQHYGTIMTKFKDNLSKKRY